MADTKIVIYSNRLLIAKGLECFFQDNFSEKTVTFFNEAEFLAYINGLDRGLIIWDNDLIRDNIVKNLWDKNFIILSIGRSRPELRQFISDFIPLKAEASYLFNLLKNHLEKLKTHTQVQDENRTELTDREKEIVRLIALGKTNQQIAEELSISPHTVITHRKNITSKLGIKTISGLTIYAILNGLVTMDEVERSIK